MLFLLAQGLKLERPLDGLVRWLVRQLLLVHVLASLLAVLGLQSRGVGSHLLRGVYVLLPQLVLSEELHLSAYLSC